MLVETLVVERGRGADLDDGLVRALCLGVCLVREQQFAAPELHFVDVMTAGIGRHQLIQGRQRLVGLRIEFVGPRQLVEHRVVALIFRIRFQQGGIQVDGFGGAKTLVGNELSLDALGFGTLEIQIAQTAQGFGAQRGIARVQVEKALVAVHGLVGVDVSRRFGVDVDLLGLEVLDGRRVLVRRMA